MEVDESSKAQIFLGQRLGLKQRLSQPREEDSSCSKTLEHSKSVVRHDVNVFGIVQEITCNNRNFFNSKCILGNRRYDWSDPLDDIYLGPDDDLDSNSRSSSGLDVLNVISNPSSLALAHGLALYDDLDLYLGPEDTLILSDDAPAVPNLPMAANELTSKPHPAMPVVPEALIPSMSLCQLDLMIKLKHHGNLPAPTVEQLLEADRLFRMAWAETCNKLRKADADLWRMQRVRESTSEILKVLDTLIEFFEDSSDITQYSVLGAWYLVLGAWCLVLSAWYSVLRVLRTWDSVPGTQCPVHEFWYLGLGTGDLGYKIRLLVL
ncbi:hypothetical protein BDR06DRAFT_976522 [Suillus hirtellus]|nr:hypothetical protein BDR06DRAFT_976522 [Suillus hirtellus]